MVTSPAKKKNRYLLARIDPALAHVRHMEEMDADMEAKLKKFMDEVKEEILNEIAGATLESAKKYKIAIDSFSASFPQVKKTLFQRLSEELTQRIASIPHIKGDKGDSPSEEVIQNMIDSSVRTNIGGKYISPEEARNIATSVVAQTLLGKKEMTEDEVKRIVQNMQTIFDPKENAVAIARALETLVGVDRLDYKALKNRPAKTSDRDVGLIRGGVGGNNTLASDLSSQCDGSNRTFTVPAHSRAILLVGTDTPVIYRSTTDFVTSGTTLTIDSGVAAPLTGATLIFLYAQ